MTYRIEEIMIYVDQHPNDYSFAIREYSSPQGEYHNEAVVFHTLISDIVGVIIEDMPFNPNIYYHLNDVKQTLTRLEAKANFIYSILNNATNKFNNYVGANNKPV